MTINSSSVVDAISSGALDSDLSKIIDAANLRLKGLRLTRTTKDFGLGDKVRFNDSCGTAYVRGLSATVVGIRQKKIVVKLDTPVGRFARVVNGETVSTDIVVPTAIVDHI
jgi:hypothetical protein